MSMLKYFFALFIKPQKTIAEILKSSLRMKDMLIFLFWVGLLRGIVEIVWLFAMRGRLAELAQVSRSMPWHLFEAGPFVLTNILAAYLRWAMHGFFFYLALRLFKAKVDFFQVLKVFSIILGLYLVSILINFLHCFFNLDMAKFYISGIYSPSFGIGQLFGSVFFGLFLYHFGRALGLDRTAAFLSCVSILTLDKFFYFISARIFFTSIFIRGIGIKKLFSLANNLNTLISLALVVLFLWLGFKLNAKRKIAI